ncbi:helix-turn-helix domain-containing protein [Rhodococcus sp. NPDC057297]|uniref:helix-turn-helix domain-containing protein n=1 Tax=Rhodococcus sp. NPDC057297 TaxID=3346090 RepID=UPI0036347633
MCYLEYAGGTVVVRGVLPMKRRLRGFEPGRLRSARTAAGLSGAEVARRCGIGASTYSQWELGAADPSIDALARCTKVLGIEISDVVVVEREKEHLGDLRVMRGLTQGELAKRVGVSPQHIGALERGHVALSDGLAKRLAGELATEPGRVVEAWVRVRNRAADVLP